jgi:hypothetical protein
MYAENAWQKQMKLVCKQKPTDYGIDHEWTGKNGKRVIQQRWQSRTERRP